MISGQRLDRDAANRLWDVDLLALGAAADLVRQRITPSPGSLTLSTATSTTPTSASPAAVSAPFSAPRGGGGLRPGLG